MKISIRISQQPEADFQVDAEPSETVANLKIKINSSHGHDIGKQNLIFCGKVLANDKTLESYKICENSYLVLLISRPRPLFPEPKPVEPGHFSDQPPTAASVPIPEIMPTPLSTSTPTSTSTFKYIPMSTSVQAPEITPAPVVASTSGSVSKSTFKYVPLSASAHTPASTPTSVLATASQQEPGGVLGAVAPRNDPRIAQFRELIMGNPQLRQHFIQQLTDEEPELGQILVQNPDFLLQLLDRIEQGRELGPGVPAMQSITDAEQAALQRLEALGFSRQAVVEAYFACDKSEELAANYLLENP